MAGMLFRNKALLLEEEIKKRTSPKIMVITVMKLLFCTGINEEVNKQYKKMLENHFSMIFTV